MGVETGLQIRVLRGNQQGRIYPLDERSYVLGRAISHEEVGPGRLYFHDPTVASVQAIMRWNEARGHYVITHETSQSRTWIAGLPLTRGAPRDLKPGLRLKIGNMVLVLERQSLSPKGPTPTAVAEADPLIPAWTPPQPAPELEPEAISPTRPADHVDKSWLPKRTYQVREGEILDGPVAEFFPDGQLKSLCLYVRGKQSHTHHHLVLEQGVQLGRVVTDVSECVFSGGIESVMTQFEGEVDYFESEVSWEVWVRKWIQQICGTSVVNLV
ncbi:MAG: FHA domain-containing protein [Candidatus Eremiobacteraeota bacterium]|nr:FHA domain-containing protein [Candidatus Eremiobacteraeota bacterium]MCW5872719.1 FHA domain-containing protein [Candidatus Eremiobacteraeota bacterium]